jgi:hypothetical protein
LSAALLANSSRLTSFFDVVWVPAENKWHFRCLCRNVSGEHTAIVKAWRNKDANEYDLKPDNLVQHLCNTHAKPFSSEFWAKTRPNVPAGAALDAKVVDVIQLAGAAQHPWSLSDLFKWFDKLGKAEKPSYDAWLAKVATVYRAEPARGLQFGARPVQDKKAAQTLKQVIARLDSKVGRDKTALMACEAILSAKEGLPFRIADSEALELLLGTERALLPNRHHVRAMIDVLHVVVLQRLEAKLQAASSFSILFDCWSSKSMAAAFLAVVYTYVDCDFNYGEALLDVIPLRDRRHTGDTLALEIALRIESHTDAAQMFYGSTTDNAKNVVFAAREVLNCYNDLLVRARDGALETASQRIWVRSGGAAANEGGDDEAARLIEQDLAALRAADDNASIGVAMMPPLDAALVVAAAAEEEEDDDDDPISDLDGNRAHQCYLHDLNLCILSTMKAVKEFRDLMTLVDRITAAVGKSTLMQNQLRTAQTVLKLPTLKLIKRCPTRWNSAHQALQRFVAVYPALRVLAARRSFEKCASFVRMPNRDEVSAISGVAMALEPLKVLTKVLETSDNCIAYLPLFTIDLLEKLKPHHLLPSVVNAVRDALRDQVKTRLLKHYTDGAQPSMLAALLHPATSPFLFSALERELGEESAIVVLRTATANCKRWIDEAFNDDAQPVALASMKRARYMVDDEDSDNNDDAGRAAAQQPRRQADMKAALKAVLGELDSDDFRHTATRVLWSAESLALARQQLRQFYVTPATKDVFLLANLELIKPLARLIFSLSPVSAGAERAFSCSGRINSPMRNKLSPDAIEKLTVIQYYLATAKPDLKQLAAEMMVLLDSL